MQVIFTCYILSPNSSTQPRRLPLSFPFYILLHRQLLSRHSHLCLSLDRVSNICKLHRSQLPLHQWLLVKADSAPLQLLLNSFFLLTSQPLPTLLFFRRYHPHTSLVSFVDRHLRLTPPSSVRPQASTTPLYPVSYQRARKKGCSKVCSKVCSQLETSLYSFHVGPLLPTSYTIFISSPTKQSLGKLIWT